MISKIITDDSYGIMDEKHKHIPYVYVEIPNDKILENKKLSIYRTDGLQIFEVRPDGTRCFFVCIAGAEDE